MFPFSNVQGEMSYSRVKVNVSLEIYGKSEILLICCFESSVKSLLLVF